MRNLCLLVCIWLAACNSQPQPESKPAADTTSIVSNDTIPEKRLTVSRKPVDSYYTLVGDPKLERRFGLSIYETPFTFRYLIRFEYEAIRSTDTLSVPNFGVWPVVQIRPGKDKLTRIIGFLDTKKQFRECKMLSAQGDRMKLTVLKQYGVGRYKTAF